MTIMYFMIITEDENNSTKIDIDQNYQNLNGTYLFKINTIYITNCIYYLIIITIDNITRYIITLFYDTS